MNDCATCGMPLVWSINRERVICSIYGDHATPVAPVLRLVAPVAVSALMAAADAELYGETVDPMYARGRLNA